MKVFISWSGELSKKIGEALNEWLPQVIQSIEPFFSPEIQKGKRWQEKISVELQECKYGIICLTPDNLHADWILFESGAISKIVSESNVATLLINLEPSDVTEPLSIFQATKFEKADVFKLLLSINSEIDSNRLKTEVLERVFEKWWQDLEIKINKALEMKDEQVTERPKRTESEKLDELIEISRGIQSDSVNFREILVEIYNNLPNSLYSLKEYLDESPMNNLNYVGMALDKLDEEKKDWHRDEDKYRIPLKKVDKRKKVTIIRGKKK